MARYYVTILFYLLSFFVFWDRITMFEKIMFFGDHNQPIKQQG